MNEIISVTKDGETYEAYVKSFSPSGKYFVGKQKGDVLHYCMYKVRDNDGNICGEFVYSCIDRTCYEDFTSFTGILWYEDRGFAEVGFRDMDTYRSKDIRLYMNKK